jgi:phosphoacetylglucosamine mutase
MQTTVSSLPQLVLQFAKDEGIPLGGQDTAQVLLGRDTRPTGAYLLDAALQVCHVHLFLQNSF